MQLAQDFPEKLVTLVRNWLIPLFILYNVVGWVGLPNREATRSTEGKYTDADLAKLQQALRAAWFVGVLAAVVALWMVLGTQPDASRQSTATTSAPATQPAVAVASSKTADEFNKAGSKSANANSPGSFTVLFCVAIGLALGIVRGWFPHWSHFRGLDRHSQRLILAGLVFLAVAVSLTCGVIYLAPNTCACGGWWKQVIAYVYALMLVGYSMTLAYQAAK